MSENKWLKNSLVYLIIIVAVIALWFTVVQSPGGNKSTDISSVIADQAEPGAENYRNERQQHRGSRVQGRDEKERPHTG